MSDRSWQDKYFHRGQARRTRPVSAPKPTRRSAAMQAWIDEIEAAEQRSEAQSRAMVNEVREKYARERHDVLRQLVQRFGAEAVTTLSRRIDPTFTLPRDLCEPTQKPVRGRGKRQGV